MIFTGKRYISWNGAGRGPRSLGVRVGSVLGLFVAAALLTVDGGLAAPWAPESPALRAESAQQERIGMRSGAPVHPVATSPVPVRKTTGGPSQGRTANGPPKTSVPQSTQGQQASPASSTSALLTWWWLVLGVGVGAGAMGLLYWIRVRRLEERMEARTEELRDEKQRAEDALETVAEQAERLEEMSETKSRFLKELSHAFRTPLTLTLGPLDNLLEGKHGSLNEEARTQLRLARRNGTRLLWLVNQLLDLAELETGNMSLDLGRGNLVQFVAKSTWSFEGLAERRDLRLGLEASLDDSEVWYDESKMEKILANLLSGAFRAADEGEAIRVKVRSAEEDETTEPEDTDLVEIVVESTGSGIPSELRGTQSFDYDDYGQRNGESWESEVSTGVGLYLVEELVDLHDGHLQVDRTAGEGVRFVVRLPRRPEDVEEGKEATEEEGTDLFPGREDPGALMLSRKSLSLELKGKEEEDESTPSTPFHQGDAAPDEEDRTTVLVIDDSEVICTLVRSHLEPEYRVEEAHEGATGYNLARSLLPDLVISDIMMPEMDGFELCQQIKEDPDVDHIPVIFLTARADLEDKVEGLDVGADAYLTKPFEPEELIAHVENLISTRQSLRQSFQEGETEATQGDAGPGVSPEGLENAEEALPPTAGGESLKERIEETIADNLTDPEFGVSDLAQATALSSSQLRRRMKKIYDCTPVQLIRRRRLEAGARLLRERQDATIGEVAYAVGFNSQSYFSRSFRDEFGTSPSRYRAQHESIES